MTRTRERNVLSWKDGHATAAIVDFVKLVTTKRGIDFVAEADRIAVFDNDGTLWCEQPFYFQGLFAFDRIKALAPQHPEWKEHQPFKAVLDDDMKALAASGEKGLLKLVMVSHAGNTTAGETTNEGRRGRRKSGVGV